MVVTGEKYATCTAQRLLLKSSPMALDVEKLEKEASNKQSQRGGQQKPTSAQAGHSGFKAPKSQARLHEQADGSVDH